MGIVQISLISATVAGLALLGSSAATAQGLEHLQC